MASNRTTYTLRIDRQDVQIQHTAVGIQVKLKNGTVIAEPGEPSLPVRILHIALPEGHIARGIRARVLAVEPLTDANAQVAPALEPGIADALLEDLKPRYVSPDPEAYAKAFQRGRKHPALLAGTTRMGEVPVATVYVQAVRSGPDHELELIRKIEISIRHEAAPTAAIRRTSRYMQRQHTLARSAVVNPTRVDKMALSEHPILPKDAANFKAYGIVKNLPDEIDYLIVTDSGLTPEFERLATVKQARGLQAKVVKLSDIKNGVYGNFKAEGSDTQEILRNFLKAVVASRGVEYVLLGGDYKVIPVRLLCCPTRGTLKLKSLAGKPPDNEHLPKGYYAWQGDSLFMHMDWVDWDVPDDESRVLTLSPSGNKVTNWDYYTSDNYQTKSDGVTEYVCAKGLAQEDEEPIWYCRHRNFIPSDLYYASLYAPTYDQPGKHDWDLLGNKLYGQWLKVSHQTAHLVGSEETSKIYTVNNLGGGDCSRDVQVGRVPASSFLQAADFIDKLLKYESSPSLTSTAKNRFNQMVIAASNFTEAYDYINRKEGDQTPTDAYHQYVYIEAEDPLQRRTVFHSKNMYENPGGKLYAYPDIAGWPSLVMPLHHVITGHNNQPGEPHTLPNAEDGPTPGQPILINYDPEPGPGKAGWYYAIGKNSAIASQSDITITIPAYDNHPAKQVTYKQARPTMWIVVHADPCNPAILTPVTFGYNSSDEVDISIEKSDELYQMMQSRFPRVKSITRLYTDDIDAKPGTTPAKRLTYDGLQTALNSGPHLFAITGHGGPSNISAYFNQDTITQLTNDDAPFIAFADSCHTASFDGGYDNVEECLGEALVNKNKGGAIAYVGFSHVCWCDDAWELQHEFFKALGTGVRLGEMFESVSQYAALRGAQHRWHAYALTLFGDPEMVVYKDALDLET